MVVLGEAPTADDAKLNQPFSSPAGQFLQHGLFKEAGLDFDQWHKLNVFLDPLPGGDVKNLTANKTELKKLGISNPTTPALHRRYLRPEYEWCLADLSERLEALQPDLILALGGTALWALTGESAITNFRGNFFQTKWGEGLATFHPYGVIQNWANKPLVWADLVKIRHYLEGTLPAPLHRRLWINPTFSEIANVYALFNRNKHWELGVDIETCPSIGQITTISFSTTTEGICIPLWDRHAMRGQENFWKTLEEEVKAWRWIERFAALPNPKVLQNGLYDMQYLLDAPLPIRLSCVRDDTAIMQHAYQPELPKALGTLSSLYLNEPSWKQMRTSLKDANKADD